MSDSTETGPAGRRPGGIDRLHDPLQNGAGLDQKHPAGLGQMDRLRAALEKRKADFILKVVNLAA